MTIRTTSSGINYASNHEAYLSPSLTEAKLSGMIMQYMVLEYKASPYRDMTFYRNITKHIRELYQYDSTLLKAGSLDSLAAVILVYPGELLIRCDLDLWRITAA